MKSKFTIIALMLFIVLSSITFSQSPKAFKFGIVDVEAVVKELPEAAEADKQYKDLTQIYRDSLVNIQKNFQEKFQKYDKQKAMMTPDQQKNEEESLKMLEAQYMQFQNEKFGQTGELVQAREKLLLPIREKVRKSIEKVAKEEGIALIIDKNSAFLLYAEEKNDLTFKVIDSIKRGSGQ